MARHHNGRGAVVQRGPRVPRDTAKVRDRPPVRVLVQEERQPPHDGQVQIGGLPVENPRVASLDDSANLHQEDEPGSHLRGLVRHQRPPGHEELGGEHHQREAQSVSKLQAQGHRERHIPSKNTGFNSTTSSLATFTTKDDSSFHHLFVSFLATFATKDDSSFHHQTIFF